MPKLELKNVSYSYSPGTPFEKKALQNISLSVEAGSITGIIGHTGSGKSTLVRMFNGLLSPNSGEVLLDGVDINADKKALASVMCRVGLVMQYPEYQLFDETVEKDISFGPKNMKLSEAEIDERVREAARFTGIPDEMLARSPFDLSGGQKRRVAIAGVLAMRPEVIVLDEPAAGLDPMGRKEILGGLVNYRDRTGAAIVIVSHNMEDMANYCDKIIVLKESREAFEGTLAEVFSRRAELEENGLDVPDTVKLADELRKKGIAISADVCTPDALAAELASILGYSGREGAKC
ncbi:MAG: energy-coupling factor transporter ATPase [Clostridia bacterium]|nr:energy-coupling factor transporter ATPase [Clostridia bacterium]